MPLSIISTPSPFYQGHLNLADFGEKAQSNLANAKVLCVGAGGLACHLLPLLVTAGIGRLTVIDDDCITTSNLQRQTLFTLADRGQHKAEVVASRLRLLNVDVSIDAFVCALSSHNAQDLFNQHDLVIDCADSAQVTHLINHTAVVTKRPWVYGAVEQMAGQYALFVPRAPCYACVFPVDTIPPATSCSARGIFSPIVAIVAAHQAALTLGYLAQHKASIDVAAFFTLALTPPVLSRFTAQRNSKCDVCVHSAPLAVQPTVTIKTIGVSHLQAWQAQTSGVLLDVRSSAAYHKYNIGGVCVPFGLEWAHTLPTCLQQYKNKPLCLICNQGNNSKQAASLLAAAGFSHLVHLAGGISEWRLLHND